MSEYRFLVIAWAAFNADPEWQKVRKESIDQSGQIAGVIQVSLYKATPYSPVKYQMRLALVACWAVVGMQIKAASLELIGNFPTHLRLRSVHLA